jgi:hypothetical protein
MSESEIVEDDKFVEFRKGDIVEYSIMGLTTRGFSGTGMVLDDNIIEEHILDPDRVTGRVLLKDITIGEPRRFSRQWITKVVICREDIKNFWEYL